MGLLLRILALSLLVIGFLMNLTLQNTGNTFNALVVILIGSIIGIGAIFHRVFVEKNEMNTKRISKFFGFAWKFGLSAVLLFMFAGFLGLSFLSIPLVIIAVVLSILAALCLIAMIFV